MAFYLPSGRPHPSNPFLSYLRNKKTPKRVFLYLAERKGFEPLSTFLHYTISSWLQGDTAYHPIPQKTRLFTGFFDDIIFSYTPCYGVLFHGFDEQVMNNCMPFRFIGTTTGLLYHAHGNLSNFNSALQRYAGCQKYHFGSYPCSSIKPLHYSVLGRVSLRCGCDLQRGGGFNLIILTLDD